MTTAMTLERDVRAWVVALDLARRAVAAEDRPPTDKWWMMAVGIAVGLGTDRVRAAHEITCRRYLTERERESYDGYMRMIMDASGADLSHCEVSPRRGWAEVPEVRP